MSNKISEKDLKKVSGGVNVEIPNGCYSFELFDKEDNKNFIFEVGDKVQLYRSPLCHFDTDQECTVMSRFWLHRRKKDGSIGFYDAYNICNVKGELLNRDFPRSDFVKKN